jgi:hypothetical protein
MKRELLDERTRYAPLILFEYDHEPGTYCLMLSDGECGDVFEANGRDSTGYGWADVALQVIRTRAPELEARLEMDPEAGTFVAFGSDLEALQQLGTLLHEAAHDPAILGPLVKNAPFEYD